MRATHGEQIREADTIRNNNFCKTLTKAKQAASSPLCVPSPLQVLRHKLQRSLVPVDPEPRDDRHSLVAEVAVLPPRLPGVHVGHVDLHKGYLHAQQRVPDTVACQSCVCSGVLNQGTPAKFCDSEAASPPPSRPPWGRERMHRVRSSAKQDKNNKG